MNSLHNYFNNMNVSRDNYSNTMSIATPQEKTLSLKQQTSISTSAVIPSTTIAATHTNSSMSTTNTGNASNNNIGMNNDRGERGRSRWRNNTIYMNVDVAQGMCQGVHAINGKSHKCRNKATFFVKNSFNLCHKHKEQKIDY